MRPIRPILGVVLLILAQCAPSPQAPVTVMALVLGSNGSYAPTEVTLNTVSDVVALTGSAAELRGGAEVIVDPDDPLLAAQTGPLSNEDWVEIFLKKEGRAPKASYIEKEGVLWPEDFHSWNLLTTYYNFEQSQAYFSSTFDGAAPSDLQKPTVLYFPKFYLLAESPEPLRDNALFFPPVQAFAILPFDQLQKVPLSINLGVVGHEYAHLVFNRKVFEGQSIPDAIAIWSTSGPTPALNILKAIDEGLADFHAYGVTCKGPFGCDSRYFIQSLNQQLADERDLARPDQCMGAGLKNALDSFNVAQFTGQGLQYRVGTVFAAALYQAGIKTGQLPTLQKAVVRSYDLATNTGLRQLVNQNLGTPETFTVESVANALVSNVSDNNLKTQLCSEFWDRLNIACASMPCNLMPACPASTVRGTSCP